MLMKNVWTGEEQERQGETEGATEGATGRDRERRVSVRVSVCLFISLSAAGSETLGSSKRGRCPRWPRVSCKEMVVRHECV